jgi:hypothetical protein
MTNGGGANDPDALRIHRLGGAGAATAVEGSEAADAATAADGVAPTSGIDAVAEALATGAIDATEARARLVDEMVRASLPAGSDPALVEEIRAQVEALLAGDPTLERLLARR